MVSRRFDARRTTGRCSVIVAWVTVSVLLVAGCGQGTGSTPPGGRDASSASGATNATADEATTNPPPDARTVRDAPAGSPDKQAGLFFPQVPTPAVDSTTAFGGGRLIVRDRCVYLTPGGVVVWPNGYSLRRGDGGILVLNGRGEVAARIGEEVRIGGGQITEEEVGPTPEAARRAFEEKRRESNVPDGCRGPLWVSSGIVDN